MSEILSGRTLSRREMLKSSGAFVALGTVFGVTALRGSHVQASSEDAQSIPQQDVQSTETMQELQADASSPSVIDEKTEEAAQSQAPTLRVNEPSREDTESEGAKTNDDGTDKESYNFFTEFPSWYEAFTDPSQSYTDTALQSLATTGLAVGLTIPLKKMGLPLGNSGFEELLRNKPEKLAEMSLGRLSSLAIIEAPLLEEALFRAIPSALVNTFGNSSSTTNANLPAALVTSVLFAEFHNLGADKRKIPLAQFLGGMTMWRIHRSKGYMHAVAGHALNNTLAMGLGAKKINGYIKEARTIVYEERVREIERHFENRQRIRNRVQHLRIDPIDKQKD